MKRRRQESGYALLLILLMGAILAISLYREIPRIAFDSQRQKEQMLIERGEQYKRAIQLFMRKNQRWPQKIEDLENTNNIRYLRKRYTDPMTGKDEWRVIHITNGVLTDSKVQTKKNGDQKNGPLSTYLSEVAGLGQTLAPGANGQPAGTNNPALRRRGSDGGVPGVPGNPNDPTAPGAQPPGVQPPGVPGGIPGQPQMGGITGVPPGVNMPGQPNNIPGQPGGMQMPGGVNPPIGVAGQVIPGRGVAPVNLAPGMPSVPAPGTPGQAPGANSGGSSYLGSGSSYLGGGSYLGGTPTSPTTGVGAGMTGNPGVPGGMMPPNGVFPPGTPVNSQTGGVSTTYGIVPGSNGNPPGFNQPGMNINPQAQNAAANMINQILTQPSRQGMPMNNTQGVAAGGSGIAGFASTADQDSIMVYNEQTNYGLWEFVFDPSKQKLPMNLAGGGAQGTPASQIGNQIGTPASQVGTPVAPAPQQGGRQQ